MPERGSTASASGGKRPALVIGSRFDWPPAGTSKMNPCRSVRGTLETPVKSGPTSGPLTVSSQVIQEPHGVGPPEQFICVPLRLVNACTTSPNLVTSIVVVPPPAIASYGVPGPNAGTGLLTSWLRTKMTLPFGPANAAMPSWRPGRTVVSSSVIGPVAVSWNERYWKPSGTQSRTVLSRRSGTGRRSRNAGLGGTVGGFSNPVNGPANAATPAAAAPFRTVRRLSVVMNGAS